MKILKKYIKKHVIMEIVSVDQEQKDPVILPIVFLVWGPVAVGLQLLKLVRMSFWEIDTALQAIYIFVPLSKLLLSQLPQISGTAPLRMCQLIFPCCSGRGDTPRLAIVDPGCPVSMCVVLKYNCKRLQSILIPMYMCISIS